MRVHEKQWSPFQNRLACQPLIVKLRCDGPTCSPDFLNWNSHLLTMQLLPIFGPWSQSSQHKRSWTQHQCRLQIRPNCVQTIWISLSIIILATYTNGSDLFGERYKLSFESFPEASVSQIQSSQLVHMKFIHPNHPNLSVGSLFFSVAALSTWRWATSRCQVEVPQSLGSQGTRRRQQIPKPRPIGSCNLKSWGWWCLLGISMISMICFSYLEDFLDGFLGHFFFKEPQKAEGINWRLRNRLQISPFGTPYLDTSQQNPPEPNASQPSSDINSLTHGSPWVVGCCVWDPLFTENVSYPGSQMGIPKFVTSTKDQVSRKLFRRLPEHRNLVHTHRLSRFGASPMKNSPGCFWHSIVSSLQTGWLLHSSQHLPVLFGNINCPLLQWSVKHNGTSSLSQFCDTWYVFRNEKISTMPKKEYSMTEQDLAPPFIPWINLLPLSSEL